MSCKIFVTLISLAELIISSILYCLRDVFVNVSKNFGFKDNCKSLQVEARK